MKRKINRGKLQSFNINEMLELVVVDGKARGISARNLATGELERHSAHAVVIASGGYGNIFFLSTNAMGSFFFQAEDGIRDADVTGVQTCALPISGRPRPPRARSSPCRPSARPSLRPKGTKAARRRGPSRCP